MSPPRSPTSPTLPSPPRSTGKGFSTVTFHVSGNEGDRKLSDARPDVRVRFVSGLADLTVSELFDLLCAPKRCGLQRLEELLLLPVATHFGSPVTRTLSFQHELIPLLRVFASPQLLLTTMRTQLRQLIQVIISTGGLNDGAIQRANYAFVNHSTWQLRDPAFPAPAWVAKSLGEMIEPVLDVLILACSLIHNLEDDPAFLVQASTLAALAEEHPTSTSGPKAQLLIGTVRRVQGRRDRETQAREAAQKKERRDEMMLPATPYRPVVGNGGPGALDRLQPRHDNDREDFRRIRIAPTRDEMFCRERPFLPSNHPHAPVTGAPEWTPSFRLIDRHFRLLREDMLQSLRHAIIAFRAAGGLSRVRVGRFRSQVQADQEAVDLYCYHGVRVVAITSERSTAGLSYLVSFETPFQGTRRSATDLWEGSKRLQVGALVGIWIEYEGDHEPDVIFAVVDSRDVKQLTSNPPIVALRSSEADGVSEALLRLRLGLPLAGPAADLRTIRAIGMLEAVGNNFFSYEPVLAALQQLAEAPLPFENILCTGGGQTRLPDYLRNAGELDLSSLLDLPEKPDPAAAQAAITLKRVQISEPDVLAEAMRLVAQHSTLDASQVQAVQSALSRDFVMIQGPPGTGKTFVGVKIMKLLLANATPTRPGLRILPILCICYTNHALDQFLEGLIKAGIPESAIIRVGGRSKSERFKHINLQELAKALSPKFKIKQIFDEMRPLTEKLKLLNEEYASLSLGPREVSYEAIADTMALFAPVIHQFIKEKSERTIGRFDFRKQKQPKRRSPEQVFTDWRTGRDLQQRPSDTRNQRPRPTKVASPAPQLGGRFAIPGEDESSSDQSGQEVKLEETDEQELEDETEEDDDEDDPLDFTVSEVIARQPPPPPSAPPRPLRILQHAHPLSLTLRERHILIQSWITHVQETAIDQLRLVARQLTECKERLREAHNHAELLALQRARVVGMTTSGAARRQRLLQALMPQVVMIEEAAEVLEAHVLSSLSARTQQLIMIGDHLQLRPKVESYTMAAESGRNVNLDVSLFERLADPARLLQGEHCPIVTLTTQRRMRPQISALIRSTLYPSLIDGPSTLQYPSVPGMRHNLFFLQHDEPEVGSRDGESEITRSKVNAFEVRMVVALAQYLFRQGYSGDNLTILTPYLGQLFEIRKALSAIVTVDLSDRDQDDLDQAGLLDSDDEEAPTATPPQTLVRKSLQQRVRVATVDNFQGEESDVVIISLVRCNKQGRIGFLRTNNRINVLISRAKHGMYFIGNDTALRSVRGTMWPLILENMEKDGCVGRELELHCPLHPDTVSAVRTPADFARVSDGGCTLRCDTHLPCGHVCLRSCHPDDRSHQLVECQRPCERLRDPAVCPDGHRCMKLCHMACGPCQDQVEIQLLCGHKQRIACHRRHALETIHCVTLVTRQLPCGHNQQMQCGDKIENVRCLTPCRKPLPCGHVCPGNCGSCAPGQHASCRVGCRRSLSCGHLCRASCHAASDCPPCTAACAAACPHARCQKSCGEICISCLELCDWHCTHRGRCSLPCSAPCNRLPCELRCELNLSCGHRCPSLCGEPCPSPDYCTECRGKRSSAIVDLITSSSLQEVDLDADPIIVLSCGHAWTRSTLDGHMELGRVYALDEETGIATAPIPFSAGGIFHMKSCPECRAPIVSPLRYGRRIKKAQLDLLERRYLTQRHSFLDEIETKLQTIESAAKVIESTPDERAWQLIRPKLKEIMKSLTRTVPNSQLIKVRDAVRVTLKLAEGDPTLLASCGAVAPSHSPQFRRHLLAARVAIIRLGEPRNRLPHKQAGKIYLDAIHELELAEKAARDGHLLKRLPSLKLRTIYLLLAWDDRLHREACAARTDTQRQVFDEEEKSLLELLRGAATQAAGLTDPDAALVAAEGRRVLLLLPRLEQRAATRAPHYVPLSIEERRVIVEAMRRDLGGTNGHWFTCPNGHTYTIGECGGAMQRSSCYECGAIVGGESHQLAAGNRAASDL